MTFNQQFSGSGVKRPPDGLVQFRKRLDDQPGQF